MAKKTEARPPVDGEDDDRRGSGWGGKWRASGTEELVAGGPVMTLSPQPDTEPSAAQDEHRGLAARIWDLRKLVESNRLAQVKENSEQRQKMAQVEQLLSALATRIDRECEALQKMQTDLRGQLHDSGEQVRQSGALARKIQDGMKELEELRAVASDPHEVVKPVRASIAQLRADVEALARTIDIRFEQLPKSRAVPLETRGEDEDAIAKLGIEVRKLRERVKALEPSN